MSLYKNLLREARESNAMVREANYKQGLQIKGYCDRIIALKACDVKVLFEVNEILAEYERGWFIKIPTRINRIKKLLEDKEEKTNAKI